MDNLSTLFGVDLPNRPDLDVIRSELDVLNSIYGDGAIRPWQPSEEGQSPVVNPAASSTVRYEVHLSLPAPHEDVSLRILVSLHPTYPAESPPQMQLLSRYIGPFGVDSELFGSVLRTFISVNGVDFTPDTVCVFDGMESIMERCVKWYEDRLSAQTAGELLREDAREHHTPSDHKADSPKDDEALVKMKHLHTSVSAALPEDVEIFQAEPIIDRKSAFVGRACRISNPSQVPLVLAYLMSDRRIAKAAHPIINAWRCHVGAALHQDNDDDGETAAGGRIAHLLQILDADNVLVVVTRYFGGTLLGPDRFKHINQAARDALELGGFLNAPQPKRHDTKARGSKR